MPGSSSSQSNIGLFVPTTNVWDIAEVQNVDLNSPEFRDLLVRLYQNINNISLALNLKDTGYYTLQEFLNSQVFFPNPLLTASTPQTPTYRQVFRTVVNFGALPNNATKTVVHGINITNGYSFTRIYATASNPVGFNYIPIPHASSVAGDIVTLSVNATHVTITTHSNKTAFTLTYVVLEYIKQ